MNSHTKTILFKLQVRKGFVREEFEFSDEIFRDVKRDDSRIRGKKTGESDFGES